MDLRARGEEHSSLVATSNELSLRPLTFRASNLDGAPKRFKALGRDESVELAKGNGIFNCLSPR